MLAALAGIAFAVVWVGSDHMLARRHDSPLRPLAVPTDAGSIAEGSRLATLLGCQDGCHGRGLDGAIVRDDAEFGRVVAPDLRRVAAEYTDSELERVIRRGVRRDGSSVFVMPVANLGELADEDVARIVAYLRSAAHPPRTGTTTGPELHSPIALTPRGRVAMLAGELPPAAETVHHDLQSPPAQSPKGRGERGAYLARAACGECHGIDLRGHRAGGTPDLAMITTYPPEAFVRLLRTGRVHGDRDRLHAPSGSASRFAVLTDEEIAGLDAYLRGRAEVTRASGG